MNRQAVYGFLLGVLVIGVGVIAFYAFVLPDGVPTEEAANLPSRETESPATGDDARSADPPPEAERETVDDEPPRESFADAPPLFEEDGETAESADGDVPTESSITPEKRERIEEIQAELTELSQSGDASPARVGQLIGELRAELGRDEVGGVKLGQLEDTVERAGRIQELAGEMESIAANPSESDRQRIEEIMSEIQGLQGEMPDDAAAYGVPEAGDQ